MLKNIIKNYRTDKFTSHTYLNVYEDVFKTHKDSIKNLLEIGVQYGLSIQLWNDFLPNAKIYGVDIIPLPNDFVLSDRMTHIIGDAYDVNFMQKYFNNIEFDLIIDDGPHTLESMEFFSKHYNKLLTENGVMIIEDIPVFEWTKKIINALPNKLQNKAKIIDNRYINNRWDDICIVVNS